MPEQPQPHQLALPAGTLLRDQHQIEALLGRPGGFGIAYLARDLRLGVPVAVKEYLPADLAGRGPGRVTVQPHSDETAEYFRIGLQHFLLEARTLARLNHPGIVRVRDFFEENGTAYLVMDYYEGMPLSELLDGNGGRMEPGVAVDIMVRVLDALNAAHRAGILHRDVKPSNLYLTHDGRPILLDFGAARQAVGEKSRDLTAVLTEGYAPFEQYMRGGKRQGAWTDVYACAATLYRMVTGVEPPGAPERVAGEDELKPPRHFVPGLGEALDRAILRGLALNPQDRPQSALEFSDLLTGHAAPVVGRAGAVQPPPLPGRQPAPAGAAPAAGRIVGGLVAAGLVLGTFLAIAPGGTPPDPGGSDSTVIADTSVYTTTDTTAGFTDTTATPPAPVVPVQPFAGTPATSDTDIPALGATVTAVRFFESGPEVPPVEQRSYAFRFAQSRTRYVGWELLLDYPVTAQETPFELEAVFYAPDGTVFTADTLHTAAQAGWRESYHYSARGFREPGSWPAGSYQVEFLNAGRHVAAAAFEIVASDQVPAAFPEVGARITGIHFFGCGTELPAQGSERFRYRFAAASIESVCYWMDLGYPSPSSVTRLPMDVVLYGPDGIERGRLQASVEANPSWTGTIHRAKLRTNLPDWATGTYRVEFEHAGERIATGYFDVY